MARLRSHHLSTAPAGIFETKVCLIMSMGMDGLCSVARMFFGYETQD